MAAWGYESYLLVLKVSLTRDTKTNFTLRRFYSLNFSMFSTYSGACMYMYMYIYIYIYIYMYRERERERGERHVYFPSSFTLSNLFSL